MDSIFQNKKFLAAIIIFAVVIIVVVVIFCGSRSKKQDAITERSAPERQVHEVLDPGTTTDDLYEGFKMDSVVAKPPVSDFSKFGCSYSGGNIHSSDHAFLLTKYGPYTDDGNQWGMGGTISVTKKFCEGRFHLTETGIYFLHDTKCVLVKDRVLDSGIFIRKVFVFGKTLYCIAGGKIYSGITESYFKNRNIFSPTIELVDSRSSNDWDWIESVIILGRDISSHEILDVDVGMGVNPSRFDSDLENSDETIAITCYSGECYIYKYKRWTTRYVSNSKSRNFSLERGELPDRIKLGYEDQELHFRGRNMCFIKHTKNGIITIYEDDEILDAVVDPSSKSDGFYMITPSMQVQHHDFEGGIHRMSVLPKRASRLLRNGNEAWCISSGSHYFS